MHTLLLLKMAKNAICLAPRSEGLIPDSEALRAGSESFPIGSEAIPASQPALRVDSEEAYEALLLCM